MQLKGTRCRDSIQLVHERQLPRDRGCCWCHSTNCGVGSRWKLGWEGEGGGGLGIAGNQFRQPNGHHSSKGIHPLVLLVQCGDVSEKVNGITALWTLSANDACKAAIVAAGGFLRW